jgi:hypothetical protein
VKTVLGLFLGLATTIAAAQTTASGPYYATPSWDQQMQCDTASSCPRFIVLSNWRDANFPSGGAAVLDRETGLVWERSPSTSLWFWDLAEAHCINSTVGNRLGWHLPTVQELTSLLDPSVPFPGPVLPAGHPFMNVQGAQASYWSSTTTFLDAAWHVATGVPFADRAVKTASLFAWCVRGGQGVDTQ